MDFMPSALLFPGRALAGEGASLKLVRTAAEMFGPCGLLLHGRSLSASGMAAAILESPPFGTECREWTRALASEPTVDEVDSLRAELRMNRPDWIAAVGGGSVMDLAKAAAALVDSPRETRFYQMNPGELPVSPIPVVAAPTTAGTGSEATVVSVLTDPERGVKASIRHPSYMPRLVILDPMLLRGCPAATRAAAGLDAFVQAYESFTSRKATAFTRALSEIALSRIAADLLPFFRGDDARAAGMLEASFAAGIAFSHARLGIIHGLAHPLGVRFRAPHGLCCACCLPACLEFNRPAIQADLDYLKERLGIDVLSLASGWLREMRLASPFAGGKVADRAEFIKEALASGSTAANPRPVGADDVAALLDRILAPEGTKC